MSPIRLSDRLANASTMSSKFMLDVRELVVSAAVGDTIKFFMVRLMVRL